MTLPAVDSERVERFLASFNAIEHHIRDATGRQDRLDIGFMAVVGDFRKRCPWVDVAELGSFANLRNVLVHETLKPKRYLSVPTEDVVRRIAQIHDGLTRPQQVGTKYRRNVVTVANEDSLAEVLTLVRKHRYSQFPVVAVKRVLGLVTENGITRCLARHASENDSLIELREIYVKDVLRLEEAKDTYGLVARWMSVDQVRFEFESKPLLEAILITQNGSRDEGLLGIATRWDVTAAK